MIFEEAIETADKAVFAQTGKHLNEAEMKVIEGAWQSKEYSQMAEDCGYSVSYLKRDIGPRLWKLLSEVLGEEVSKRNLRAALERKRILEGDSPTDIVYVERPPLEEYCHRAIEQPGSLIRIKAPRQMGKTLLMNNILEYAANKKNYRCVYLNLLLADNEAFEDLNNFLSWFCAGVASLLQTDPEREPPPQMVQNKSLGSKLSCTDYFEDHLLTNFQQPLVLGIDNIDQVFSHKQVAPDFFALLRAWHESGKINDNWKKLRLVVAHSTEVYIPLHVDQSPFNVGIPIELREFRPTEVEVLARRYGLDWDKTKVKQMMEFIGGHPLLVSLAFEHLVQAEMDLKEFLETAHTEAGPYRNHLWEHWSNLKEDKALPEAMKKVVWAKEPVRLETELAFKLNSMGLVRLNGDNMEPRCKVYRSYFKEHLPDNQKDINSVQSNT